MLITLFEKYMDKLTFRRTLVISSMMFSDSVESLLWPPIMMILEPVETAQDLNIIFGLLISLLYLFDDRYEASVEGGTLRAQLGDLVLQTKCLQDWPPAPKQGKIPLSHKKRNNILGPEIQSSATHLCGLDPLSSNKVNLGAQPSH